MTDYTFKKHEKLCSKKTIEGLFEKGSQLKHYPFKVIYSTEPFNGSKVRVMISVPKKNHKRAVKRNYIKRRIREAYRLNKSILHNILTVDNITINIAIIYVSPQVNRYKDIEQKLIEMLTRLAGKIEKANHIHSNSAD